MALEFASLWLRTYNQTPGYGPPVSFHVLIIFHLSDLSRYSLQTLTIHGEQARQNCFFLVDDAHIGSLL